MPFKLIEWSDIMHYLHKTDTEFGYHVRPQFHLRNILADFNEIWYWVGWVIYIQSRHKSWFIMVLNNPYYTPCLNQTSFVFSKTAHCIIYI